MTGGAATRRRFDDSADSSEREVEDGCQPGNQQDAAENEDRNAWVVGHLHQREALFPNEFDRDSVERDRVPLGDDRRWRHRARRKIVGPHLHPHFAASHAERVQAWLIGGVGIGADDHERGVRRQQINPGRRCIRVERRLEHHWQRIFEDDEAVFIGHAYLDRLAKARLIDRGVLVTDRVIDGDRSALDRFTVFVDHQIALVFGRDAGLLVAVDELHKLDAQTRTVSDLNRGPFRNDELKFPESPLSRHDAARQNDDHGQVERIGAELTE